MMALRSKKNTKTVQAEKVEATIAETPAVETSTPVSQETPNTESQETPVAPVVDETPAPAKAAKKRYASIAVLSNPNAVITYLAPNPKRNPESRTFKKYALFEVGMSVKEIEELFVAKNWGRMKARNQLRWDIEHGYVVLGVKEEAKDEVKAES
jgi:hypothetical protein